MPTSLKRTALVLLIGLQTLCLLTNWFPTETGADRFGSRAGKLLCSAGLSAAGTRLEYLVLCSEAKPGIQTCIRPIETPRIAASPSAGSV